MRSHVFACIVAIFASPIVIQGQGSNPLQAQNDSLRRVLDSLRTAATQSVSSSSTRITSLIPTRPTAPHAGTVSVDYDRFGDTTTVFVAGLDLVNGGARPEDGLRLAGFYFMPGQHASMPARVTLVLTSTSRTWQYLECHTIAFLADGNRIPIGEPIHDGKVELGGVMESVHVDLPVATFLQLATARLVEGKLCTTEFVLTTPELLALQDFASRMKDSPPPASPAPQLVTTGVRVAGATTPQGSSGRDSLPARQVLIGWTVAIQDCVRTPTQLRCSVSITNSTSDQHGFRLENVRAMRGGDAIGDAKDFYYYPRASFGTEKSEGKCNPSATCSVQFSLPVSAGTTTPATAQVDGIAFSLSIWSGWGQGHKVMQSDVTRIPLPRGD